MNEKVLTLIKKIPGWLSVTEGKFLENTVMQTEKLKGEIVEIGSFHGKSTIWLAQGKSKVYAIDPHKGEVEENLKYDPTYKEFVSNLKSASVHNKVVPIIKTSEYASKNWNKKIKFLFIDGLHDEENARLDFELWSRYVINGGVIAIHDGFLRWNGSEKNALRNIVNSPDFYEIGTAGSIIYGVKGNGNTLLKMKKCFVSLFINIAVLLNHIKIIMLNLPEIIKQKRTHNVYFCLM